jgi:enamine deaminase RidA (YjgF/YER057c/UK114 family)
MTTFFVRPNGLPPVNGYSHVVSATGTVVHMSGQVPAGEDGTIVDASDIKAQCEQMFANLATALAVVGAAWRDVVKTTYFLLDMDDLPVVRAVRDRHLDPDAMVRSTG